MKKPILLIFCLTLITSCFPKKDKSPVSFTDKNQQKSNQDILAQEAALKKKAELEAAKQAALLAAEKAALEAAIKAKKKYEEDKIRTFKEINDGAAETFKVIQPIFVNKCTECHDSNFKLPPYGKIFKKVNPFSVHFINGVKAFDFGSGYPFHAQGNPPQIALLKAIKNVSVERSMPLKVFTAVYPSKKISADDERKITDWAETVIEKLQDYDKKYNPTDANVTAEAHKILEMKCFRCHANGNNKGSFGDMDKTADLLKSKYINLDSPDTSSLLTHIIQGKMPPSKLDALSDEETNTVRDWLELESKKVKH